MAYLRAKDTVNGALGTCYARIDGERHELMQVEKRDSDCKENQNGNSHSGTDRETAQKRRLGRHRKNDGVLRFQPVP